ncbi:DUF4365 domain-containing protein [Paraburkholderia fungorum]|uniref:DUF4365 domain-containing protein n=1 Tax=Paraburkholderia fungorum TaxID=134537 RepID=UPI0038780C7A
MTKKSAGPTQLPKRGPTHKIDTQAVRLVLTQLSPDWLIRSLEERDYGIDLQLEFFDNDEPTGHVAFIQVKGTTESFDSSSSFSLPVKTLLYAELFSAPFFLFRTSITDQVTRFAWLQKFASTTLISTSPNWRNQDHVNILMPEENDLLDNSDKFLKIVQDQNRQRMAIDFMRIDHELRLHAPNVAHGEVGMAPYCSTVAKRLTSVSEFIKGDEFSGEHHAAVLAKLHTVFDDIAATRRLTETHIKIIFKALDLLDTIKTAYLSEEEIHQFISESGIIYY